MGVWLWALPGLLVPTHGMAARYVLIGSARSREVGTKTAHRWQEGGRFPVDIQAWGPPHQMPLAEFSQEKSQSGTLATIPCNQRVMRLSWIWMWPLTLNRDESPEEPCQIQTLFLSNGGRLSEMKIIKQQELGRVWKKLVRFRAGFSTLLSTTTFGAQ